MKIIKRVSRPDVPGAVEQGPGSGLWLVPADATGTAATRAQVDATTVPHPAGGGRRMLRQVPAGVVLIEVVDGRPVAAATVTEEPKPLDEPTEVIR